MEALDEYEKDLDFEKLKIAIENASHEELWGLHGMFSCLTDSDNALPQLLRTNYQYRFELLIIMVKKMLNKDGLNDYIEDDIEDDIERDREKCIVCQEVDLRCRCDHTDEEEEEEEQPKIKID
jgi:hypothetical protein